MFWPLVVFLSRVLDVALGTYRVQLIIRRKKTSAALVSFVEILIYILIVNQVLQDISNLPLLMAYAGGFALGTVLGIYISEKMSRDVVGISIISREHWQKIETELRKRDFGVTRQPCVGKDGKGHLLRVVCWQERCSEVEKIVHSIDEKAFLYSYALQGVREGYLRGVRDKI